MNPDKKETTLFMNSVQNHKPLQGQPLGYPSKSSWSWCLRVGHFCRLILSVLLALLLARTFVSGWTTWNDSAMGAAPLIGMLPHN